MVYTTIDHKGLYPMANEKPAKEYVYYIRVNPILFAHLNALSLKSRTSIEDLSDMAVRLLLTATRRMPSFQIDRSLKPAKRRQTGQSPSKIGAIAADIIKHPRRKITNKRNP